MEKENRPRGREKNVTSGTGNVFKRGEGLGSGPVGKADGYAGKTGQTTQYSSYEPRQEQGARRTRAAGSSSLLRVVVVIGILVMLGGGGGLTGLLGGGGGFSSSGGGGQTPQQQITPQTGTGSGSGTAGNDAEQGVLDTSVAQGAREKRTQILGGGKDTSTIMVYMCGTDLESRSGMATNDIREMMEADFGGNINLLIYTGGCNRWQNNAVSSRTNQIWQVKDGDLECLEEDLGAKPMTDSATLSSFIQYCAKNFPSNRNQLIFWDHGGGSVSGYGYDEKFKTSGGMTLAGIQKALRDGGQTFDFIGFDTCLMATVENALMLDEFADYMIASEETEPGIGWYYTNWLTQYGRNTSVSTPELGKMIIDEFTRACNVNCRGQKTTLSIVDLAELSATVPSRLSAFSKSISGLIEDKEYKTVSTARYQTREFATTSRIDQVDLTDLARNMGTPEGKELADALTDAVKYNRTSANMTNAYGLSIYFPYQRTNHVDSAVNTYHAIGMDSDYSAAIREFAALQTSGQVVAGGTGSPVPSLLGTLMQQSGGGSSLTSADMIGTLLSSFMGSDFSSIAGLSSSNSAYLFDRAMPDEELAAYLADNQFDTQYLQWQPDDADGLEISMPEEQWDLIQGVDLNMFYDDGSGYIDLGLDNVFTFDDNGDLQAPEDPTWIALDGNVVPYYHMDTVEGEDGTYTITGRVPCLLNNERVNLLLVFDNENPQGYVAGAIYDYVEGETEMVAKSLGELQKGDTIDFLCDFYSYDGTYQDSYMMGNTLTVEDDIQISDMHLKTGSVKMSFRFTDIYNREYWTESLDG